MTWAGISCESVRVSMGVRGRRIFHRRITISIILITAFGVFMPARALAQTFNDVGTNYWAFSFIETFAANGITAGCGGGNFCPEDSVTRTQMAVFLERGMRGSSYSPPAASGNVFLDVGAGDFAASFIEQLFADGITAGCGNNNYCPDATVTRDQMAVFLLRAKYGSGYIPPPATGVFGDVPLDYWAVAWIEQLAAEGITAGCGSGNYCPDASVTRAQMAVFMVRTFGLPIPSADTNLASLSISGVTLDPDFSSETTSYTATVSNGTDSVDVAATTSDGSASFTINGSNNTTVALAVGDNTITIVVTAADGTTTRTYTVVVTRLNLAQEAYVKASNTDAGDDFGWSVALSGDGNTLAVGAIYEESAATGVDGDQADNSRGKAGAAYVYTGDSGGVWTQQAYIKAAIWNCCDRFGGDQFGSSVALSDDGNTLAIGASYEDSAATGVNGDPTDNTQPWAGAAYVFTRDGGGVWTQQAYVKASNTGADDFFGTSVALSADGNTLAVGAINEDSAATGVNGDQADNSAGDAGAVYVYTRDTGGVWTQQAYVKASNAEGAAPGEAGDFFGGEVALSGDGNMLAVAAHAEDSAATGVNGDQTNNSAPGAGAVYVFTRDGGGVWTQQAYVKASNTEGSDIFGRLGLTLSDDGNTLAVGAPSEDSAASGVGGNQTDNTQPWAGAVYVFARDGGGVWSQQAYVKASNTGAEDFFGDGVALSADGNTLVVGAGGEDSAATGVNGDQADNSAPDSGAVYVFTRDSGGVWTQQTYVKAANTDAVDFFRNMALSGDGNILAVGAVGEDSAATGVNGDQADNSASGSGAVYLMSPFAASADPITIGNLSSNDDGSTNIIIDTLNNLEWLRWDVIPDLNYADTLTYAAANGWSIAGLVEVQMFVDAMFGAGFCDTTDSAGQQCGSNPGVGFQRLTGNNNGPLYDYVWFLSDNERFEEVGFLWSIGDFSPDPAFDPYSIVLFTDNTSIVESDVIGGDFSWLLYRSPTSVP